MKYFYREQTVEDLPLILDSWLNSFYQYRKEIPWEQYYLYYKNLIYPLLVSALIIVVCDPEDPNNIVSWMVYSRYPAQFIIHYAYTKKNFRKQGIIHNLLQEMNLGSTPIFCTFPTRIFGKLHKKHKLQYLPLNGSS